MAEFEPTTDLPGLVDGDDKPVPSTAKARDLAVQGRRKLMLRWLALGAVLALVATGLSPIRVIVAVAVSYFLLGFGFTVIGSFARPVPEAPPPGELRKVKLTYRCPSCGAELRMSLANDQVPAPPRHCQDDMELTTDLNEL